MCERLRHVLVTNVLEVLNYETNVTVVRWKWVGWLGSTTVYTLLTCLRVDKTRWIPEQSTIMHLNGTVSTNRVTLFPVGSGTELNPGESLFEISKPMLIKPLPLLGSFMVTPWPLHSTLPFRRKFATQYPNDAPVRLELGGPLGTVGHILAGVSIWLAPHSFNLINRWLMSRM